MSGISCHVLDTTLGRPAAGVHVRLERLGGGSPDDSNRWLALGQSVTNADGRATGLETAPRELGRHRITFETEEYFRRTGQVVFYPLVQVQFNLESTSASYHVPLLLSPFGYSTYRGS